MADNLKVSMTAALEAAKEVVAEVEYTEKTHTRNAGTDYNCRQWFVEHGSVLLDLQKALEGDQ